ncbi:MAG: universal stress protein [Betaproteobacteria bacterium]|nr:MAG: universal stress protein [Betaproteobacteria bacterium]
MFKMLVAVDGSEHAQRTLDKVVELAAEMHAPEVHLLNVQDEPTVYGEVALYLTEERARQLVKEAGQRIVDAAAERLRAAGVSAKTEVEIGDVAPTIVSRASDLGCNVIVMGTRGMGAIASLVLGSVATKVVHLTTTPVLLVH